MQLVIQQVNTAQIVKHGSKAMKKFLQSIMKRQKTEHSRTKHVQKTVTQQVNGVRTVKYGWKVMK